MSGFIRILVFLMFFYPFAILAQDALPVEEKINQAIDELNEPLYSPFIERYVLDELKQLRTDQAATKQELIQQIVDREHHSVDRAVAYATDTVTYFFYLIAAASSVLVIVGWTSIREMKERVHSLADEEISKLVQEYEKRLATIERQLRQKTRHIEENREEIELTQDIQSLWLRIQQESSPNNKINILDDILKLRPQDAEALTYKADAVLDLNEPQWAINLCVQALALDPHYSFALYQMACAQALKGEEDKAVSYLDKAIQDQRSYAEEARADSAFKNIKNNKAFKNLINN